MGHLAELETPLFNSAHSALVFAFNFSGQSYDRPMMNRMADGPKRSGKGLVGLDGAGQAGMIRGEVAVLGKLHEAIVTAYYAPHSMPCDCRKPCCSGSKINPEWSDAIGFITQAAIGQLSGACSNYRLRRAIVSRNFGEKCSLVDIANACGVNRDTASAHNEKISLWLSGYRPKKGSGQQAIIGEIERAKTAAAERLHIVGLVFTTLDA